MANSPTPDRDLSPEAPQYRTLFELNPHPLFVFELDSLRFLAVNEAALRQYGYGREEFLGMTATELRPPEEQQRFLLRMEQFRREGAPGLEDRGVWRHVRKDGSMLEVDITAAALEFDGRKCVLAMAQDVSQERADDSERRERDRQVQLGQKMEAVSRLAGGVAHEFNNILTGIMGLATLIQDQAGEATPIAADAGAIVNASKRAAGLVLRLLTFSRQKEPEKRWLDLNELITRNRAMASSVLGERILVAVRQTAAPLPVHADSEQLDQVLLNLCLNARDAMHGEGRLTLSTRVAELEVPLRVAHGTLPPGRYAMVSIEDSGHGIATEHKERIFEPFFTTRSSGHGTGLGLAMAYATLREHEGMIDFDSEPGRGSAFRLYLPLASALAAAPAKEPPVISVKALPGSRGTVLVADDEAIIRSAVSRVLAPYGFRLLLAADGEEAVKLFADEAASVNLLLLDVVMPKVDGLEAYERMRQLRDPLPPVLFMSGYATARAREVIRRQGAQFLPKPFMPRDLLVRIEKVLGVVK